MSRLSKHQKKLDGNGTTIYFRTKHHEMKIYDKVTECREKKRKVPKEYEGLNVMRIEQSYKGRLNQEFGFPVKVMHLTERAFFADLRRRWQERYEAIEKTSPQPMLSCSFGSEKELILFLAKYGLKAYGADRVESEIEGIMDSKKRYKLRKGLRKAERFTGTTLRPSLTKELDNEVNAIIADSMEGRIPE